jgi:hypothetical protein
VGQCGQRFEDGDCDAVWFVAILGELAFFFSPVDRAEFLIWSTVYALCQCVNTWNSTGSSAVYGVS